MISKIKLSFVVFLVYFVSSLFYGYEEINGIFSVPKKMAFSEFHDLASRVIESRVVHYEKEAYWQWQAHRGWRMTPFIESYHNRLLEPKAKSALDGSLQPRHWGILSEFGVEAFGERGTGITASVSHQMYYTNSSFSLSDRIFDVRTSFSLTQEIFGASLPVSKSLPYKHVYLAERAKSEAASKQLMRDAFLAYIRCSYFQEMVDALKQERVFWNEYDEKVNRQFSRGLISRSIFLRHQSKYAEFSFRIQEAEGNLIEAWGYLLSFLSPCSAEYERNLPIFSRLPVPRETPSIDLRIGNCFSHPEYEAYESELVRVSSDLEEATRKAKGKWSISAGVSLLGRSDSSRDAFSSLLDDGGYEIAVGVRFAFPTRTERLERRRIFAERQKVKFEMFNFTSEWSRKGSGLQNSIQDIIHRWKLVQENKKRTGEMLSAAREDWENGLISYSDLLQIRLDSLSLILESLKLRFEYANALVDAFYLGVLDDLSGMFPD